MIIAKWDQEKIVSHHVTQHTDNTWSTFTGIEVLARYSQASDLPLTAVVVTSRPFFAVPVEQILAWDLGSICQISIRRNPLEPRH